MGTSGPHAQNQPGEPAAGSGMHCGQGTGSLRLRVTNGAEEEEVEVRYYRDSLARGASMNNIPPP